MFRDDPQLAKVDQKWGLPTSTEAIDKACSALRQLKHQCDVVDTRDQALDLLKKLNLKNSSIYLCGSTTLSEIGWTDYLKKNPNSSKRNIKNEAVAAQTAGQNAKFDQLMREGLCADYVFTSVSAVTETGEILSCCLTGTRSGALAYSARTLVIVVGSNKIVKDYETAVVRQTEYCLPLESARVRVAYNLPASNINFSSSIRGANAWGRDGRVRVIIVKEPLGY